MNRPENPIAAVVHRDPYPYYASLVELAPMALSMGPKMRADLVKIADRPQISSPSETTPSSRRSPGRAADAATGG